MGWDTGEKIKEKKGMETTTKILIGIIVCVLFIILLIVFLLMNIKQTSYVISVDGNVKNLKKTDLLTTVEGITYVNIEQYAKIVGYAFHKGEYKAFTISEDKCYVQGNEETASFYLNDNKVRKLPVGKLTENYREFKTEQTVKNINGKMFASVDAINLAFNTVIKEGKKELKIYTLDSLIKSYNAKVINWGYEGIIAQNFENKKALLYDCLIVRKKDGLYKIIDSNNTKEIVSDRYNVIQFTEYTKEFSVTNSLGQIGIINLDGTTKIEPIYKSISILDKADDLYLIQKENLYGVVKSGNITIIYPEYNKIGIDTSKLPINQDSQYVLLNKLIPVCKNNKWGAYDKKGKEIIKVEYDAFGCEATSVKIEDSKKEVTPVLTIEECSGIVIKKDDKYGIISTEGKELVPIATDSIYSIEDETTKETNYYMLYNNQELNVIDRLTAAGLIEDSDKRQNTQNDTNDTMLEVDLTNQINKNTQENNQVNTAQTNNEIN